MAANARFEISSGSSDVVPFVSGYSNIHRNQFPGVPSLDKGSSFRENYDNRPLMQGSGGTALPSPGHTDLPPLSQVLSLEPVSLGEQKYARQLELRRATNAALGTLVEDQSLGNTQSKPLDQLGLEELRRVKASIHDNALRARERSRLMVEAISKLDRFQSSMQSRKRSRPESAVHERPVVSLSVERSATTGNSLKTSVCTSPNHTQVDVKTPKLEDRSKAAVPNKRVRTSMADVRLEGRPNHSSLQRSAGLVDRDREAFRPSSSLGGRVEERDRLASTSSEGWEKTKMKGKRSGTKSDAAAATVNRALEGEREHKWGVQHRLNLDGRSKPSEGHGFRSGPMHGIAYGEKAETNMHPNGLTIRSLNRSESDGSLLIGEKGDRFVGVEKERLLPKNGVKPSHRVESYLVSTATVLKAKAARAPRSSSGAPVNPSAHASRAPSGDVWDHPVPNKVQLSLGPTNRKRPAPTRSSSSPVTQWVGQRPPKMARIARRKNLVPPVGPAPTRDETLGEGKSCYDGITTVGTRTNSSISAGSSFSHRVANASTLSQGKSKNGKVTSLTGLSESEESENGAVVKSKVKVKDEEDSEGRLAVVSQRIGSVELPAKKPNVGMREEGGDGVRRQGRSGRGLVSLRGNALVTTVEKVDSSVNANHVRSAKPALEKSDKSMDIKPGRPPTKKGAIDRKALAKDRHPVSSSAGGDLSDDDHEELAAVVHATVNASVAACSNDFWKQMEPYFAYLTEDDHEYLKQQIREFEEMELRVSACIQQIERMDVVQSTPPESPAVYNTTKVTRMANGNLEADGAMVPEAYTNLKDQKIAGTDGRKQLCAGWLDKMLPLSQRLLAALVIEGDSDEGNGEVHSQSESLDPLDCARDSSLSGLSDSEQVEVERREQEYGSEMETIRESRWRNVGAKSLIHHDFLSSSNGHRSYDAMGSYQSNCLGGGDDILVHPDTDVYSCVGNADKYVCMGTKNKEDQTYTNQSCTWEVQYQQMSLDDRILLELQSIGLFPEPVPDLAQREEDEICEELKKFQFQLKDQICSNIERIQALEKVVSSRREAEEREREYLAMTKLVEVAYSRRMGCRGGITGYSGNKISVSKGARAAALAFAKRTLMKWGHFIETGESCLTDGGLRDILFCVPSKKNYAKAEADHLEAGEGYAGSIVAGSTMPGNSDSKLAVVPTDSETAAGLLVHQVPVMEKAGKGSSDCGLIASSLQHSGGKENIWLSRMKEKEVLLEDVHGSPIIGGVVLSGTKGKSNEREGDGNAVRKETVGNSDGNKGGRQGLGNIKGERKTKTKPRQKTAPLLKAVNGLLGKPVDFPKESSTTVHISCENQVDKLMIVKDDPLSSNPSIQEHLSKGEAPIDLSHLQLPGIEDFTATDEIGGQGQDLGSWLDFEDPGLQDAAGDFVGLDVPMDDLSDLAMMM